MWLSSDVGTAAHQLKKEFDHDTWDFSELSDVWWYTDEKWKEKPDWRQPGTYVHAGEPEDAFRERLERFKDWIKERPEDTIGDDPSPAPRTHFYTKRVAHVFSRRWVFPRSSSRWVSVGSFTRFATLDISMHLMAVAS